MPLIKNSLKILTYKLEKELCKILAKIEVEGSNPFARSKS